MIAKLVYLFFILLQILLKPLFSHLNLAEVVVTENIVSSQFGRQPHFFNSNLPILLTGLLNIRAVHGSQTLLLFSLGRYQGMQPVRASLFFSWHSNIQLDKLYLSEYVRFPSQLKRHFLFSGVKLLISLETTCSAEKSRKCSLPG